MKDYALNLLRSSLDSEDIEFRNDQWESIQAILENKRLLVVQRTGWGKSMVYFLATKLLREQGKGPTILISPLLSLMRNQIDSADRIGINAKSINSVNQEDWDEVFEEIRNDNVDLIIVSPERLANDSFRETVLDEVASNIGLFVVDEAHCISDWGHDFRPDYRRIVRILDALPSNIPVLATTATANNRVVEDISNQLGENIDIIRGPLVRESLSLQNITMPNPAVRLAWITERLAEIAGSGIIYTLTQRDAERVQQWLQINDISAEVYHSGVDNREELETQLINNEIKVLVATVALGMGFDKPDLKFVIHFQRPSSVVHYYQQVGRAGRGIDEAYGILLHGEEDESITNFFIHSAFPPQYHIQDILSALDSSDDGLSVNEMQRCLNLKKSQIDKVLKFLRVESPSPIVKIGSKYKITAAGLKYNINREHIDSITSIRRNEQQQMQDYMNSTQCLMLFLSDALDDSNTQPCGKCINCLSGNLLSQDYSEDLVNRVSIFLKRSYQPINPRKQWPKSNIFENYNLRGYKIIEDLRANEGRALSLWRDAGWGQLVYQGKYEDNHFSDELVTAFVKMIREFAPEPFPTWVTNIPSGNHPELVPNFASRVADELGIPYRAVILKARENRPQKEMENSYNQVKNLDGVFALTEIEDTGSCFLIDDMIDSGWTFTVASALLREQGVDAVVPMALCLNSPRMD